MTARRFVYALSGLLVLAIAALLYYGYSRENPTTTTTTATSTIPTGLTGGEVHEVTTPKAPDYKRPLVFSSSVSAEVRAALNAQLSATIDILNKKPTDFQAWINLGTVRKIGGDYKGAEEDWLYVSRLYPKSSISFDNLGSLYLDFLKDYTKAESSFKQSIALDPHDINAYQQLFALYTVYGYKAGTSAAADLVAAGLKSNPTNATLLQYQAQLQGTTQ